MFTSAPTGTTLTWNTTPLWSTSTLRRLPASRARLAGSARSAGAALPTSRPSSPRSLSAASLAYRTVRSPARRMTGSGFSRGKRASDSARASACLRSVMSTNAPTEPSGWPSSPRIGDELPSRWRTLPSSNTRSNSKSRNSRPNRAAAWMGKSSLRISTPSFIGRKFTGRTSGGAVTETFEPRGRRSSSLPKRFASIRVPSLSRAIHTAAGTVSRTAWSSAARVLERCSLSIRAASARFRSVMSRRMTWMETPSPSGKEAATTSTSRTSPSSRMIRSCRSGMLLPSTMSEIRPRMRAW